MSVTSSNGAALVKHQSPTNRTIIIAIITLTLKAMTNNKLNVLGRS